MHTYACSAPRSIPSTHHRSPAWHGGCTTNGACRSTTCRRSEGPQSTAHRNSSRLIARAKDQESETLPPWARKEELEKITQAEGKDLPFFVYLLLATVTGIVAVGSISEFLNKNAIFGKLPPENPLYIPVLAVFVLGGVISTGILFSRAVSSFNKDADNQNKIDGY